MKKIFLLMFSLLLLLSICNVNAYAFYEKNNDISFDYSEFKNKINSKTQALLDELGIEAEDTNGLLDLSPRKIINLIISILKGEWKKPFKCIGIVLCLCVMSTIVNTLNVNKIKNESLFDFFEAAIILVSVVSPLSAVFVSAISAMKLLSDFMLAYIPVFTGVISAGGMALSAFSYNAVLMSFCEICSKVSTDFILPCVFIMTLISIYSSAQNNIDVSNLISVIKRLTAVSLSLTAGIFTGLLSLKSKISVAADSLAVKGVKLISGSVIPIIGGAIGDAFSSVLGSFVLIKNTVGAFGIIVIIITVAPSLLSLILWYFSISICSAICELTENKMSAAMLKSLNSCVSFVNIILIFFATVFIVSTGIMLNLRG